MAVFLSPFENTNQPLSGNLFFHFIELSRKGDLKMDKYKLVKFTDKGFELDVRTDAENETVWLTQEEIAILFDAARSTITYHINNIFSDSELSKNTSVEKFDGRVDHRPAQYYNLDVILAVGYRVKAIILTFRTTE